MQTYRIKSDVLTARGDRIEGSDKRRMLARLADVKKYHDANAKLISYPTGGR